MIHLEKAFFTKVGAAGALSADAFWAGVADRDAADRIINDSSTRAIYYDSDGTGAAAKVKFVVHVDKSATIIEERLFPAGEGPHLRSRRLQSGITQQLYGQTGVQSAKQRTLKPL